MATRLNCKVYEGIACLAFLSCAAGPSGQEDSIKSITRVTRIAWDSDFGKAYRILWSVSPAGPWEHLGDVLPGTGREMRAYDDIQVADKRFYRLEVTDVTPPEMVGILGGKYEMGAHFVAGWDDLPVHTVRVDSFYMDATEVTNTDFCAFLNGALQRGQIHGGQHVLDATDDTIIVYCHVGPRESAPQTYRYIEWDEEQNVFKIVADGHDHPMIDVSWYGAVAYCNWRSEEEELKPCYDLETWECNFDADGYRLPTEAEWEYAARGGLRYSIYPWGDDIDGARANYFPSGDSYEGTIPMTTPVGCFPPNSYGLWDIAGNAAELCNDWYDRHYYEYCVNHGIVDNPLGPASRPTYYHGNRVLRGGSALSPLEDLRCSLRFRVGQSPAHRVGFRCVRRPSPL